MATYELGQVNLNPRGVYSSDPIYNRLDCVNWDGSSYITFKENTCVPATDTDNADGARHEFRHRMTLPYAFAGRYARQLRRGAHAPYEDRHHVSVSRYLASISRE